MQCSFRALVAAISIVGSICVSINPTPCFAQSVSPSPRTRTFDEPKNNYFHSICTNGIPLRWFTNDMPLRVLIKSGEKTPGFKPEYETALRESFREWENVSDSKIKFRYVNSAPADITCEFVSDLPKSEKSVGGVCSYQNSPYRVENAYIRLKTQHMLVAVNSKLMHLLCLHEIGHALGLVNHSVDPHDVMYPFLIDQKGFSARDLTTMKMLYDFEPPDTIGAMVRGMPQAPNYPMGLIVLSSEEYDAYTRRVVAKVQKNFDPTIKHPLLDCDVQFLVSSTGNIFNYKIFQESANEAYDKSVLEALFASLPLPPVSESLRKNQWSKVPIALRFKNDGQVVPHIEPDAKHTDWLQNIDEPFTPNVLEQLEREATSPKTINEVLEPWLVAVSQKTHTAWKTDDHGKVEILLGIRKDGSLAHMLVAQTSGNVVFDNTALKACLESEPFPVCPDNTKDTTEINLLFER